MHYEKIIIGAGIYGLYAALKLAGNGNSVCVLECDRECFSRATYVNQARVHHGYHYPRSLSTALKSASYYRRFNEDFGFCIHSQFRQIYAVSEKFSWTNREQFIKFCSNAGIYCEEVRTEKYFKSHMCRAAFLTEENTYDAVLLRDYFLDKLKKFHNVHLVYGTRIHKIEKDTGQYIIECTKNARGGGNFSSVDIKCLLCICKPDFGAYEF